MTFNEWLAGANATQMIELLDILGVQYEAIGSHGSAHRMRVRYLDGRRIESRPLMSKLARLRDDIVAHLQKEEGNE